MSRQSIRDFRSRQVALAIPVNKFPIKLAPKVPNNLLKNPPFCSFV